MITINFIDIPPLLLNTDSICAWIGDVLQKENKQIGSLEYLFCSDEYLLEMNKQFLNHDYYTDIITFDYTEEDLVSGEMYISWERVVDNSKTFSVSEESELLRVIVHGVLHLCGYKDKKEGEKKEMREKENYFLDMFHVKHNN
jgi:probable rRNA maturation factor